MITTDEPNVGKPPEQGLGGPPTGDSNVVERALGKLLTTDDWLLTADGWLLTTDNGVGTGEMSVLNPAPGSSNGEMKVESIESIRRPYRYRVTVMPNKLLTIPQPSNNPFMIIRSPTPRK